MDEMNGKKNSKGYDEETFGSLQQAFGYEGSKDNDTFYNDLGNGIAEELQEQSGESAGSDNLEENQFGKYESRDRVEEKEQAIYTSEWTPDYTVPGGNTYSYNQEPEKKKGRALEICALVIGVLSIVGCCFYGIFGVIGLVLSIVALATGRKSGLSFAALFCSILGLILSIALVFFSVAKFDELKQETVFEDLDIEFDTEEEVATTEESVNNKLLEDFEDYLDTSDDDTSNPISDEEVGQITIEGNNFTIPCKLSELLAVYEVSEYSKEDMETELDSYGTTYLALAKDGKRKGINVSVVNDTDSVMTDILEATVYCIDITSDDESPVSEATALYGISLGMTTDELTAALEGLDYEVEEYSEYTFYSLEAGDDEDYDIFFMTENDKVICIDVSYYDY